MMAEIPLTEKSPQYRTVIALTTCFLPNSHYISDLPKAFDKIHADVGAKKQNLSSLDKLLNALLGSRLLFKYTSNSNM